MDRRLSPLLGPLIRVLPCRRRDDRRMAPPPVPPSQQNARDRRARLEEAAGAERPTTPAEPLDARALGRVLRRAVAPAVAKRET